MKRKSILILLLFINLILIVVYCMERGPHSFSQAECPLCHVTDASGTIDQGKLTDSVVILCERCHSKVLSEGYMHPVNVRPRNVRIPSGFPLSHTGEITCSTCHDIHSSYLTPYGTPTHFLRRHETENRFCENCHESGSIRTGHSESMGEAHFQSKYKETDASMFVDAISIKCINCHDGSFASSASIGAGRWSHSRELMSHDSGSHPIGIDYEAARLRKGSHLRPLDLVDQRIKFFDGKVGCGSCHDPYSNIERRLVMSDRGSKLCLACHMLGR